MKKNSATKEEFYAKLMLTPDEKSSNTFNTLITNFVKRQDAVTVNIEQEIESFKEKQQNTINDWDKEKESLNQEINGLKQENINVNNQIIFVNNDKYKTFIDGVKFYFVNKDTIEYIDKAVSGELEENNEDDEDVSWDEKANAYKGELPWDSSKHFDDIDENLSNQLDESVSKDAQEVVNPVMADALRDQEEAEKVKEKATEITKDGKPTIKNESLATFDPFSALGKLEENIKRGI